jgi:signal recognition particle receptor subunit beta
VIILSQILPTIIALNKMELRTSYLVEEIRETSLSEEQWRRFQEAQQVCA